MLNRVDLIQEIFARTNFKTYLEIGSQRGVSFLPIKCKNKIAVDPNFLIKKTHKIKWLLKNPYNIGNKYFEETSDDFFQKRRAFLQNLGQLDVVLVDGLHTFRASLNDTINALEYLGENGVIVLHDCLPPHPGAAIPADQFPEEDERNEEWTGEWCGDVWKTIAFLRRNFSDLLDVSVLNTDYGLGIVRCKKKLTQKLTIDEKAFEEMNKITFEEASKDLESMIGLTNPDSAKIMVNDIASSN